MAEQADATDLKSVGENLVGSIPTSRTTLEVDMAKRNSRWKEGNKRYPEGTDLSKYKEAEGWYKGARVYKKAK